MSLYPFSTESMEWDTFAVTDEPVTTADFFVESISSEESEESTYSSDLDTDEIPNLNEDSDDQIEDSDDAAEIDIIDNPFEDLDFQNFQAAEIRDINDRLDAEIQDIHVMLDAINELSDAEDKEVQEMHAMVLGDDTEEEHEEADSEMQALVLGDYTEEELESDSEMQASVHGDFTKEEQAHWSAEEKLAHSLFLADYTEEELESDSGYGIYQAADINEGIPMVINGLGPQKSSLQKIVEWLEKMV